MKITCPHCGLTGKIPEGDAEGEPLICPRCGESFEPKRKPAPKKRQPELFDISAAAPPAEPPPGAAADMQPEEIPAPPEAAPAGAAPPEIPVPAIPAEEKESRAEPQIFAPEKAAPRRATVRAGAVLLLAALLVAAAVAWHLALALHLGRAAREFCNDPAHFPPVLGAAGIVLFLVAMTAKKRTTS